MKEHFLFLFISGLFLTMMQTAYAQTSATHPDSKLYKTIVHMDSVMFDAFNTQKLDVLKTVFAANVEFYHDLGGMTDYEATMTGFKNMFAQHLGLKRELVQNSLEIYPIPNYGAVEMGVHTFTHKENGKDVVGTFKFVHTWQFKDGVWKVTRVISVGH